MPPPEPEVWAAGLNPVLQGWHEHDQRRCIHCPVCVSLQDAKKSRLPILIKPSRSLGNVYRLPATQEVVAQLQGQILELQGELKEFKICNKQLHQKLILAEAMMEERPAADKTLQEGKCAVRSP